MKSMNRLIRFTESVWMIHSGIIHNWSLDGLWVSIKFTDNNDEISICRVWPHGRRRIKCTANRRWWIETDPLHTGVESCAETNWSWWETHKHTVSSHCSDVALHYISFKYQVCYRKKGLNLDWNISHSFVFWT